MTSTFVGGLDAFGRWRRALAARLDSLSRDLDEHDLLDATALELLEALRQRLAGDKLVLAIVAEFSRG